MKKEYLRLLRMLLKEGMKVRLVSMNDGDTSKYPVKPDIVAPGTTGIVTFIDDLGQIHVSWENGSSLALIPETDEFEIV